ncbi:ATP-grasp domain-containing protein [Sutcliffiella rhizosphaerae]|uniref:Glutathione synthetase n=1 Tax=Sutcliffiella rhizosphaerae TaxID=2880967 RepID=A0ABM8YI13_9BACI|nr:RimK family alpha-L-glutamate ligase [Sutcliffiella rhizosphaerae]CAG9619516.1 Glutathione synthetase [Sutcliffiella rhizosphaerae]
MADYQAWIIYNGNLSEEKFIELASWIDTVAKSYSITTKLVKNNHLLPTCSDTGPTLVGYSEPELPHFVIFLDKDVLLAKQFESMGIPVYNNANCIETCDNKSLTFQVLAAHGIPMPKTILAPFVFHQHQDYTPFHQAAKALGFPLVLKEAYGSFGMQVYLIHSMGDLLQKINELGNRPFLLQEFIASSKGKDIRLNVVGNEVVASMMRISSTDFRANVSNGGEMLTYDPSEEEIELAIKSSQLVGADFAGVDLLFSEDGSPLVCEINSNAHIKNIFDCTGINVASYIVPHILQKYKEHLK